MSHDGTAFALRISLRKNGGIDGYLGVGLLNRAVTGGCSGEAQPVGNMAATLALPLRRAAGCCAAARWRLSRICASE